MTGIGCIPGIFEKIDIHCGVFTEFSQPLRIKALLPMEKHPQR
jgi:hypothetical protein